MIPMFVRNARGQRTFAGFRPATQDEAAALALHRTIQLGIDIRRHYADLQKRSDVKGFKDQQKMLGNKAWREGYVRPDVDGRRPRPVVADLAVAA